MKINKFFISNSCLILRSSYHTSDPEHLKFPLSSLRQASESVLSGLEQLECIVRWLLVSIGLKNCFFSNDAPKSRGQNWDQYDAPYIRFFKSSLSLAMFSTMLRTYGLVNLHLPLHLFQACHFSFPLIHLHIHEASPSSISM